MEDTILQFSPWKIEQHQFDPAREAEIEKQLAFSNGYVSQYGFVEEYYSGNESAAIFLKGIQSPLKASQTVSVRLLEERLNLATWKVESFYRCLDRETLRLERKMVVESPNGDKLEIKSTRQVATADPHFVDIVFTVRSVNYSGPMSILPLVGGTEMNEDWYPLQTDVAMNYATYWLQSRKENVQVVIGMTYEVEKNGQLSQTPPIRIEKKYIVGYSLTGQVVPNDVVTLRMRLYITDSRNYPLQNLMEDALTAIAKND